MSSATLITAEQFARLQTPETEDYELVDGELIRLSSGTPRHDKTRHRIRRLLDDYFDGKRNGDVYGEIDCELSEIKVRRPDLSIFLGERAKQFDVNSIPVPFAPDIAVEVLSPSESAIDVNRKVIDYFTAGTREVWVVDYANSQIFVQNPSEIRVIGAGGTVSSFLLPGFSVPISEILTTA